MINSVPTLDSDVNLIYNDKLYYNIIYLTIGSFFVVSLVSTFYVKEK